MIKVSDDASKRIVSMMQEGGYDASADYVRVGVKSGGCSGLSYELKFDKELGENDKVFEDINKNYKQKIDSISRKYNIKICLSKKTEIDHEKMNIIFNS